MNIKRLFTPEKAESIIYAVRNYYNLARKKFRGKREIFYLALAWAVYAKKHHPEQYKNDEISDLLIIGAFDTILFLQLTYPESIEALSYYMANKEKALVDDYEARFNILMSKVNFSQEYSTKKISEIEPYIFDESKMITHVNVNDFRIEEGGFDQLELRMVGLMYLVITVSNQLYEILIKKMDIVKKLDPEEQSILGLMLSYTTLFVAYKRMLNIELISESKSNIILAELIKLFKMHYGSDPTVFLQDITNFTDNNKHQPEASYLSSRLPKVLDLNKQIWIELENKLQLYMDTSLAPELIKQSLDLPTQEKIGYLKGITENEKMNNAFKYDDEDLTEKVKLKLKL